MQSSFNDIKNISPFTSPFAHVERTGLPLCLGNLFIMAKEVICGIYKITTPENKIYIGQSVNIKWRFVSYKCPSSRENPRIKESLAKYGFDNHLFEILEVCDKSMLDEREIFWINNLDSFNTKHGLNNSSGGKRGFKVSNSTIDRLRESHIGKPSGRKGMQNSDATKKKLSLSMKGRKPWNKGKTGIYSDEILRKISESGKGRIVTKETRDKISKFNQGKIFTPEHREKLRIAALKRYNKL